MVTPSDEEKAFKLFSNDRSSELLETVYSPQFLRHPDFHMSAIRRGDWLQLIGLLIPNDGGK
jgi:hypothetical protein